MQDEKRAKHWVYLATIGRVIGERIDFWTQFICRVCISRPKWTEASGKGQFLGLALTSPFDKCFVLTLQNLTHDLLQADLSLKDRLWFDFGIYWEDKCWILAVSWVFMFICF